MHECVQPRPSCRGLSVCHASFLFSFFFLFLVWFVHTFLWDKFTLQWIWIGKFYFHSMVLCVGKYTYIYIHTSLYILPCRCGLEYPNRIPFSQRHRSPPHKKPKEINKPERLKNNNKLYPIEKRQFWSPTEYWITPLLPLLTGSLLLRVTAPPVRIPSIVQIDIFQNYKY